VTGQSDLYSLGVVLWEMLTGEVPFKGESQVAVAMKHVREELPDVQSRRPEVSAALAAVIEDATAKRPEDRYANDAELIADLEDVLAIETARAGSATGEVTSVLRTLPSRTQRRIPFRVRHRGATIVLVLIVLAGLGGGVAWLATRAHHGTGKLPFKAPQKSLEQVQLCNSCAQGFNPLGSPTYETPNSSLAIDNVPGTYWQTQQYYDHKLDKVGTGIYVDARPRTTASKLQIISATPGFTVTIYARRDLPPIRWPDPGWTRISSSATVGSNTVIPLTSGNTSYRYYLVWITSLGGHEQLAIDEIVLYRYKHAGA
jgi:eukaryotic-like serine/threonine-protein kinase